MNLDPQNLTFLFEGPSQDVLARHFLEDSRTASLSWQYRFYYRIRSLIPIRIRQFLQQRRSKRIDPNRDWFLPADFIAELIKALKDDIRVNGDRDMLDPWPTGYQMAASLTHDVETRNGVLLVDKIAKIEESLGFRSCWNFVPHKYKIEPELIEDLKNRGHEVGVHGYNHDGKLFLSRSIFDARSAAIQQAIDRFSANGFRSPMVHRNLEWISELDIHYDASCFDIDPFQAMPGGVGSIWPFVKGDLVELPYTMPQDHTLFVALKEKGIGSWKKKFEFLRKWRAMSLVITHPDYLDSVDRQANYREYLQFLSQQKDCWHALPKDIADWWKRRHDTLLVDGKAVGSAANEANVIKLSLFVSDHSGAKESSVDTSQKIGVPQ